MLISHSNEATEHGSNGTKLNVMSKHYFLLHVTGVFLFSLLKFMFKKKTTMRTNRL